MKKITVVIPDETYRILEEYCSPHFGPRLFLKNVVNSAILDYCSKNTANFFSKNK